MEATINERILLGSILSKNDLWLEFNLEVLNKVLDNFFKDLIIFTPIRSYSSIVFLMNFKKSNQKFILKFRAVDLLMKLGKEVSVYKILSNNIKTPVVILYGISENYEVAIYEHLETSKKADDVFKDDDILNVWNLTLIIQKALFESSELLNLNVSIGQKYASEVSRYTLKYLGREIKLDCLNKLDESLNTKLFKNYLTVFSDRAPMNWIINGRDVTPIDFDLLFVESCLADFIQFIDDHRLFAIYDRSTLISRCLDFLAKNNIYFSEEDFHWCAIYRNLTQGAIFYKVNKIASLFHYERALLSVKSVGEKLLEQEVKKILNEVAWI